ncbi:thiamine ABC transporter substrate binding subunit [Litorivicinus lipolyticus]|uniref:Thiamine ABC transporter substrate binding subunit n=1 Tax=Litorivicinus lipolyticus TaxID=418701 RepID=A0A5Q2QI40_9GAMM|nr:thiamine ABC transporter substrate binding subunit [Litorivicinus lipolyticus]QGG80695.1 thiamine ABC transporter substrate binding subunit [Litorivicinus lipolyticus]
MNKTLVLSLLLPMSALAKPVLTVSTYDAFAADWGPAPAIEAAFEAQCECDLRFVTGESSIGLLRKIQLEGDSTDTDIVLGLDTNTMELARATGLFATHDWPMQRLSLPLPLPWTDATFVPFDYSIFAFVYQSDRLTQVPSSLESLRNLPADVKLVIQDPRSSTPGLGLLLWVKSVYGDRAGEFWADVADSILTVTPGWSEAYNLFLQGEADMVLSYTTSPAYHRIAESDERFAWAAFEEGHQGQIEVAAALASSDQPQLAAEFLSFILSDAFQSAIPTGNWAYPVIDMALPDNFEVQPRPAPFRLADPKRVEAQREAVIAEFLSAIGQ